MYAELTTTRPTMPYINLETPEPSPLAIKNPDHATKPTIRMLMILTKLEIVTLMRPSRPLCANASNEKQKKIKPSTKIEKHKEKYLNLLFILALYP